MMLILPLGVSFLAGACALYPCWIGLPDRQRAVPFFCCSALLLGISISSCAWFFAYVQFKGSGAAGLIAEIGVVIGTVCFAVFRGLKGRIRAAAGEQYTPDKNRGRTWVSWLIAGALVIALAMMIGQTALAEGAVTEIYPHGDFDAWQFWNLRARFIYRDMAIESRQFGGSMNPVNHGLALPLSVVRTWYYAGGESPPLAANLSMVFGLLTPITLFSALYWLRGPTSGALAAILSLSPPGFPVNAATQLADVPFTLLALVAITLLAAAYVHAEQTKPLLILSGLSGGAAAWMKNEGLLLCVIMAVSFVACGLFRCKQRVMVRKASAMAVGMAFMLAFVFAFRWFLAGRGTPIAAGGLTENLNRITDASRWHAISDILQSTWPRTFNVDLFPWIGAFAALIWFAGRGSTLETARARRAGGLPVLAVVCLMIVGYLAVYLVTPHDLPALLNGTLFRLLLQIWPVVLLAALMWLPNIEESLERLSSPATSPRR